MWESLGSCLPYVPWPGIKPTTWYVPWLRIKPAAFLCAGWHSNQLSQPARVSLIILVNWTEVFKSTRYIATQVLVSCKCLNRSIWWYYFVYLYFQVIFFQRNTMKRFCYNKEIFSLNHWVRVMVAGKSNVQNLRGGPAEWRPKTADTPVWVWSLCYGKNKHTLQVNSEGSPLEHSVLLRSSWTFCFIDTSSWLYEAHIMEGNKLYFKITNLNVNLIRKHPHRNIQNNALPNIWLPHSPAKLTQKSATQICIADEKNK